MGLALIPVTPGGLGFVEAGSPRSSCWPASPSTRRCSELAVPADLVLGCPPLHGLRWGGLADPPCDQAARVTPLRHNSCRLRPIRTASARELTPSFRYS